MSDAALSCHACGQPAGEGADPRSPLCGPCAPVRDHVVSMRTGNAAACGCGWNGQWPDAVCRERAVQAHWRAVVMEAQP